MAKEEYNYHHQFKVFNHQFRNYTVIKNNIKKHCSYLNYLYKGKLWITERGHENLLNMEIKEMK